MHYLIFGLGVAVAVVGLIVGADEWRRADGQHARINQLGLRLELMILSAVLIGGGAAMAYAGVAS